LRRAKEADPARRPPVVVFGSGGSGTRAIAAALREAGVYLGARTNRANDSLVLKPFLRRWPEVYLERSRWVETMWRAPDVGEVEAPDAAMVDDLRATIDAQREGIPAPDAPWGWKAPRTIYVLPALHGLVPDVITVQLVRDGRDMAYSANQNQLQAFGEIMLDDYRGAPDPVRSIALWSRVNVAAVRYAERFIGANHLVLRYEDVCADPAAAVRQLLDHVGLESSRQLAERAAALVQPSPSAGRWRQEDGKEVDAVLAAGAPGLREFGYEDA
jgi:sulfotransferase family protein